MRRNCWASLRSAQPTHCVDLDDISASATKGRYGSLACRIIGFVWSLAQREHDVRYALPKFFLVRHGALCGDQGVPCFLLLNVSTFHLEARAERTNDGNREHNLEY
jgi:hypothetical protein